jgi:predicted DNA-binding protein (MmcQ/YjbR family)
VDAGALAAVIEARPGCTADQVPSAKGVTMYKLMGKMFAILSTRKQPYVILKCDPHLAEILREQYASIGHRSHLDRRFWISVDLDGDVPDAEIERLLAGSYDLIADGLTKKQKAELAALA